jgi:hypothetical protein
VSALYPRIRSRLGLGPGDRKPPRLREAGLSSDANRTAVANPLLTERCQTDQKLMQRGRRKGLTLRAPRAAVTLETHIGVRPSLGL